MKDATTQWENGNSYRSYPLSSSSSRALGKDGSELPCDVLADAALYPYAPAEGAFLVSIDMSTGEVVASAGGREMRGIESDGLAELRYAGGRRCGTVVFGPGLARERAAGRRWEFGGGGIPFSASCIFPVPPVGVTSISISGKSVEGPLASIVGSGRLSVSIGSETVDGRAEDTIRFDVSRKSSGGGSAEDDGPKIREIVVAARGDTIFDVSRDGPSSALVTAGPLTREDVCYQAHLSDAVSLVHDTCADPYAIECGPSSVPRRDSSVRISGCAVSIQAYDLLNYRNPVRISTVGGSFEMNSPRMSESMSSGEAADELEKLVRSQLGYGNGIRIEIPGAGR